ncbi:Predicted arabinose efflux permease, MFS family [Acinetobacter marinus]|uniref:Predicted arabinose efflux permease, MFS family n=1 Tax=Acinetobacter marinus TaxID=281375 RepID=A0A1G6KD66_9GAMM|nr:MFS transporter [Acinetobacter marinus]SDC28867.1 Predicted arabinose efflux permease, MFS family [Acinetobacter marinus]
MSDQSSSQTAPSKPQLANSTLWLMAMVCGICAGANYFSQPLVHSIQTHFAIEEAQAQLTVTLAQISYAVGLLLLVPLGDLVKRHLFIPILMCLTAAGLLFSAFAQNIYMLWLGTVLTGLFSVSSQVLIPLSTALVEPKRIGAVVGFLMSGLLIGILFSTTVAGLLSNLFAWNTVYWLSAILLVILMLLLQPRLPKLTPVKLNYFAMFKTMGHLIATERRLVLRAGVGALTFASMSTLFSTMSLLLAREPFLLSDFQIGLIGLSGIVGAVFAQFTGKLVDRGYARQLTLVGMVLALLSWSVLYTAQWYLIAYLLGFCMINLANSTLHVTNLNIIYQLHDEAKSRLNSIYMTSYFAGAASGSSLGIFAWNLGGWSLTCAFGFALALLSAICSVLDLPNMRK